MGTEVYDTGTNNLGLYLFANNLKGRPVGIALLIINTRQQPATVNLDSDAEQYTLAAKEIQASTVQLNSTELKLMADG